MSFPKWQYTKSEQISHAGDLVRPGFIGRVIHSEAELERLGGDWVDTPAELDESEDPQNEKEFLIAKAELAGIKIDKRWSLAKLREAVA